MPRKVYCCGADKLTKYVKPESVATVVSSPPYNLGVENAPLLAEYTFDKRPWKEYEDLVYATVAELDTVLVPGGRVWINVQASVPYNSDDKKERRRYPLANLWNRALEDRFSYRDILVWTQDAFSGGCAWGSYLMPSAPNIRGEHELILLYYKPHPGTDGWLRPTPERWKGWKDEREGLGGDAVDLYRNVWKINPAKSQYKATFPIELPARCIRLSTWPDETVLDPFCGTGTTLLAADKIASQWGVDRLSIGIEKSKTMAKVARERT